MKPIKFVITLLVFATALSAKAAPLLNGLALEQQFNKDRYIAAVYSETLADSASSLLNNRTPRRLEVRVVADGLSARRFRNQWMESIAINNPGDILTDQAENMVTFANMFKGRFVKGDRLSVAYDSNSGITGVALNGVPLGKIQDREFFNTLLRAWIGPVPPSTDFRDGLLAAGKVPSSLLASYEALEPSSDRIAQLNQQMEERAQETEAAEQEGVAVAAAASEVAPKPKLAADIPPPSLASLNNKPQVTKPAVAKPKPAASRPASAAEIEEDEEDEAPLTADLILARQVYTSMLLRHTFKNLSYPKRAQDRRQEGSVRVLVTIDRGGKVKDVQTLQESHFASLNNEARDAILRASPFPAAPPQLARDNYQFTVPITFRLPD